MVKIKTDVIIIGAGIAGLWLANSLKQSGFNIILLEIDAIGAMQTINSQGMLHSGVKYALQGKVTLDTKAIKDAPFLWQQALSGQGNINLTKNCILTDNQLLWSSEHLPTKLANFFVSNLLQSSVTKVETNNLPAAFNPENFNGSIYRLNETVLNLSTTLQELYNPVYKNSLKINSIDLDFVENTNNINQLLVDINGEKFSFVASQYIFTAGEAMQNFTKLFRESPKMQLRPLHMVAVKTKSLPILYGHNIGLHYLPIASISTHRTLDNQIVWYCGGKIAEEGINSSKEQQQSAFKHLLAKIFPWLGFNKPEFCNNCSWGSFIINRAEHLRADGKKPTHATWFEVNNAIFAWPTKLVLAPMMANEILQALQKNLALNNKKPISDPELAILEKLPKPTIAVPWWENL